MLECGAECCCGDCNSCLSVKCLLIIIDVASSLGVGCDVGNGVLVETFCGVW